MLLNLFCQIVEVVIAINATIVAIKPNKGISEPISKPKTSTVPRSPSKTPIHCFIVTLQPVLTNALSGPILGEKVTMKQWVGVFLGFVGAVLVLGLDVGSKIPLIGLIATIVALIAITSSTIWQKKLSNNLPLSVSNFYQAVGGCFFHVVIIILFAEPYICLLYTSDAADE